MRRGRRRCASLTLPPSTAHALSLASLPSPSISLAPSPHRSRARLPRPQEKRLARAEKIVSEGEAAERKEEAARRRAEIYAVNKLLAERDAKEFGAMQAELDRKRKEMAEGMLRASVGAWKAFRNPPPEIAEKIAYKNAERLFGRKVDQNLLGRR